MSRLRLPAFILSRLTASRMEFIRYLLVGGWNTLFGMLVYAALYHALAKHVHYLLILVPSNFLAITNAYACYKLFVFRTKGNVLREYLRCYVVYGGTMILGAVLMSVLVETLQLLPTYANCVCIAFTTVISYLAHRNYSFSRPEEGPAKKSWRATLQSPQASLWCFSTALFVVATVHLDTMLQIPLPWLDEVHIVEMGRTAFALGAPAVSFMTGPDGRCYLPFYYLGPALQELAYRMLGAAGPRFSAMLGLLTATVFCRLWIFRQTKRPWLATLLALTVLTHPLLVQSVRLVRIDCWAFALFFLAVYLMSRMDGLSVPSLRPRFFCVGAIAGLSLFVWPTTFFFFIFYFIELWSFSARNAIKPAGSIQLLLSAVAGILASAAVLLLPLAGQMHDLVASLSCYFDGHGDVRKPVDLVGMLKGDLVCLSKEVLRAPFFMCFTLIGLLASLRRPLLAAGFLLCVGVGILSGLHTFRFIYLFPFLYVFAQNGFLYLDKTRPLLGRSLLACVLLYGFMTSVLAYAGMALIYQHSRNMHAVTERLRTAVGAGDKCVYSRTLQDYYAARALGWKHYRYGNDAFVLEDDKHAKLLEKVDYVIDSIQLPHYAVEEGFTLYSFIRDYLIRSASEQSLRDQAASAGAKPLRARFATIGQAMAFSPPTADEQAQFDRTLTEKGFTKKTVIDLTTPQSAHTPFARWILSKLATNPDYDSLIVWARTMPRKEPSD